MKRENVFNFPNGYRSFSEKYVAAETRPYTRCRHLSLLPLSILTSLLNPFHFPLMSAYYFVFRKIVHFEAASFVSIEFIYLHLGQTSMNRMCEKKKIPFWKIVEWKVDISMISSKERKNTNHKTGESKYVKHEKWMTLSNHQFCLCSKVLKCLHRIICGVWCVMYSK